MKKSKLLSVVFFTIVLAAVLAVPVLARGTMPVYISEQSRQNIVRIITPLIFVISMVVFFLGTGRKGEEKGLWITAMVFSFLCVMGIGAIWYMVARSSPEENTPSYYNLIHPVKGGVQCKKIDLEAVLNEPSVDSQINVRSIGSQLDVNCMEKEQEDLSLQQNAEMPLFIPTGVFIQSMEFSSANDVVVTGYVWQRYTNDVPSDITRGFIMPEGDSDVYQTEENAVYKKVQGDETVYGWYINTAVRQTFDYSHYPFDRQDIWLRLWHHDFDRNVILVPDLKSYDAVDGWPEETNVYLGLERDFVLERLALERTYFNYHYNSYNTDFGIDSYVGQNAYPELYFNVGVRREVLDAFVAYMIPMFILILMSFGVQFIVTQIPDKMSMHGISTTGLIGYYASLFFIGILAQLDIRRTLNAPGVVYIEYFYFALYVILLLQTINSVIFAASDDVGFLEYKDNLYPKVIFFPITLGLMYLITAYIFY